MTHKQQTISTALGGASLAIWMLWVCIGIYEGQITGWFGLTSSILAMLAITPAVALFFYLCRRIWTRSLEPMVWFSGFAILALWAGMWLVIVIVRGEAQAEGTKALAEFGDAFGSLNTLFSGLAFIGVAITLFYQHRDQADQSRQHRESIGTQRTIAQIHALGTLLDHEVDNSGRYPLLKAKLQSVVDSLEQALQSGNLSFLPVVGRVDLLRELNYAFQDGPAFRWKRVTEVIESFHGHLVAFANLLELAKGDSDPFREWSTEEVWKMVEAARKEGEQILAYLRIAEGNSRDRILSLKVRLERMAEIGGV